jgi:hypothetical protein
MKREGWPTAAILVFTVLLALGTAAAQETETGAQTEAAQEADTTQEAETTSVPETTAGTTFQTTVDFGPLKSTDLDGKAGEINVKGVDFAVANAKGGGIKGTFSSDDAEMLVVITTTFSCATSADTKQKFDMKVEFLDEDGQVIDRAMNSDSLKNNNKKFGIKHSTLKWALDHIDKARITVDAKR